MHRVGSVFAIFALVLVSLSFSAVDSDAATKRQCRVPRNNPIVVRVKRNETKRLTFDQRCKPRITNVRGRAATASKATGASNAGQYQFAEKAAEGSHNPAGSARDIRAAGSSQARCNATSKHFDRIGLTLTRVLGYADWAWDGSSVSYNGNAATNAGWLPDWRLTDGPHALLYNATLPTSGGFEGWAGFDLRLIGNYAHEHRVVLNMTNQGGCFATNYFIGVICNSCYTEFNTYTSQWGVLDSR